MLPNAIAVVMALNITALVSVDCSRPVFPARHNSFPQPVATGGAAGRGFGKSRRAGNRACRPAADSDVRGAGMRFDRHGLLRFTIAAPVWLAERVRHARGIGCGLVDPEADGHVLEQGRTPDRRQAVLPVMAKKEVPSPGSGERDSDFRDLVTWGLDGDGLPVTSRIEAQIG